MIKSHKHEEIIAFMDHVDKNMTEVKNLIIDDCQYIMSYEFMERASEPGWGKFSEIAQHTFNIYLKADMLRDDLKVFFLSHSEEVTSNGFVKTKIKTIGKMLDSNITMEGMFTIVLLAAGVKDESGDMNYLFVTKSNGTNTVKSPEGMFDSVTIPNDLQQVIEGIDRYNEEE